MNRSLGRNTPRRLMSTNTYGWQARSVVDVSQNSVLTLALRLELLSAALYMQGLASPVGTSATPAVVSSLQQILQHENAHVQAIATMVGVTNPTAPALDLTAGGIFPNVLTASGDFFKVAQLVEDMSAKLYLAAMLADAVGSSALSTIAAVELTEARHAAQIRNIRNGGLALTVSSFGTALAPWMPYAASGATQSLFDAGYSGSASTQGTQAYVAALVYGPATAAASGVQPPSPGEDNLIQFGFKLASPAGAEAFDEPIPSNAATAFLALFHA